MHRLRRPDPHARGGWTGGQTRRGSMQRRSMDGVHYDAMVELLDGHRAATDAAHAAGCAAVDAMLSAAPRRGGGSTLDEFSAQHVRWQASAPAYYPVAVAR
jgi:hypothetical protein